MVEGKDAVKLAHNVYIDFPDSLWGRFCLWFFQRYLNGRQAVYDHAFRELRYSRCGWKLQRTQRSHERSRV